MSERAALAAAVAASPDDDLPKLVLADWLDENGDPARAEFVRLHVAYQGEADRFPPAHDPDKRRRLVELFAANYRTWLKPVYDAFAQPLPALDPEPGRPVRLGFREADSDSWHVHPQGGIIVTRQGVGPLDSVILHGGLVSVLHLSPGRLSADASFGPAQAVEPLGTLVAHLTADAGGWRRIDGPPLARVRSLSPTWDTRDDCRAVCQAICRSDHLTGLRRMTVLPELTGGPPTAHLFDALRHSPLRHQLTALTAYDLPQVGHLLARSDHGFDALRSLTVSVRGRPAGADGLFAGGVSDTHRERLTRLVIDTSRTHGLAWLTDGRAWERLEELHLHGAGVGEGRVEALATATESPHELLMVSGVG